MISIIVPFWNSSPFINDCLASIARQTEMDWECILVDDGSEDDGMQTCLRWNNLDSRFKVFRQNHLGVSAARNRGLKESSGDYIVFVDSDDSVSPKYLENLLAATPADLVVGGHIRYLQGRKENPVYFCPVSETSFTIDRKNSSLFADLNKKFLLYGPCAKLYRADIIKDNHLNFPLNRALGEDLEFNYSYLRHINTITSITVCDYWYNFGANNYSISSQRLPNQFDSDIEQWRIIRAFCRERDLLEDGMNTLLFRRLWEILYDSLFLDSHTETIHLDYFKRILIIPEIHELKWYQSIYPCSRWIKLLILSRFSLFFFLNDWISCKFHRKSRLQTAS